MTCAICLEDVQENASVLECGHSFHLLCLLRSFKHKNSCPTCRRTIDETQEAQTENVGTTFVFEEDRRLQNYIARVNRGVRNNNKMACLREKVKRKEKECRLLDKTMQRTWKELERSAWNSETMQEIKKKRTLTRQSYRRYLNKYTDMIEENFPPPDEFSLWQIV